MNIIKHYKYILFILYYNYIIVYYINDNSENLDVIIPVTAANDKRSP